MTDDDKIIERLTRLEEQVKSIPALLEVQIVSLVARLEDVAQVITLHNETMAKNLDKTNEKVENLNTRVTVLEHDGKETRSDRRMLKRYFIAALVILSGVVVAAVAYIQALP